MLGWVQRSQVSMADQEDPGSFTVCFIHIWALIYYTFVVFHIWDYTEYKSKKVIK